MLCNSFIYVTFLAEHIYCSLSNSWRYAVSLHEKCHGVFEGVAISQFSSSMPDRYVMTRVWKKWNLRWRQWRDSQQSVSCKRLLKYSARGRVQLWFLRLRESVCVTMSTSTSFPFKKHQKSFKSLTDPESIHRNDENKNCITLTARSWLNQARRTEVTTNQLSSLSRANKKQFRAVKITRFIHRETRELTTKFIKHCGFISSVM